MNDTLLDVEPQSYRCAGCGATVLEEEAVWIDPNTGTATTGEEGKPFHVGCAPGQDFRPMDAYGKRT